MRVLTNEFKFCYTKSTEDKTGLEKKHAVIWDRLILLLGK